jgi:hypothetical protein
MYKRPTIRRTAGGEGPKELSYVEQMLQGGDAVERANSVPTIPVKIREIFKKFKKSNVKPLYKLFNLKNILFTATADASYAVGARLDALVADVDLKKHPEITTLSIKGGRFTEIARLDAKGTIMPTAQPGKPILPNQIAIEFIIDGKKNFANLFYNSSVRVSGTADEDKVISYIESLIGPLKNIKYSLRSGQVDVNKSLNIEQLQKVFPMSFFPKDSTISSAGHVLHVTINTRQRKEIPPAARHQGIAPTVEYVNKKLFTLSFFNSGVIQYKGEVIGDIGDIIWSIKRVLSYVQLKGVFEDYKERTKTERSTEHKTTVSNPPEPANSFEGKCPDGYYCRPNSHGLPNCYIIPEINENTKETVVTAYKRFGIPIPRDVRLLFKIVSENKLNQAAPPAHVLKLDDEDVLRIDGRRCDKFTEDDLETIARRLGIPDVRKGVPRYKMCQRLAAYATKVSKKKTFVVDGVSYYIDGDAIGGAKRSNGKANPSKKCTSHTLEQLMKFASALGINPKGKSKGQICEEIRS